MSVGDETLRDAHVATKIRDPLIGAVVGDYKVEDLIGTGAMGIVYRAVHTVIGKPAALKVLKPDFASDPDMVARLVREARTVNSIRHPGIVDIFGFGNLPTGQPYIVMDLLEGEPLDAFIRREAPLPLKRAWPYLDELLSALAAAHAVGVIHRDLKPGNIFLERHFDRPPTVKLLDFGLARQADRAGGSIRPTNPGTLLGTPAFMAPEQVMGQKTTPATDLYAVGGIAYQMFTNHLPHEAPSAIEVLSQKMQHDPIRPRQWNASVPEDLDTWVMAMLHRDEPMRPQSADEVRRALKKIYEARVTSSVPAHQPRSSSGVVPRRDWGEAKTILVDGSSAASPDSHDGPTATMDSPFSKPAVLQTRLAAEEPADAPITLPGVPAPDLSPPRPWELKQPAAAPLTVEPMPPGATPPNPPGASTLPPDTLVPGRRQNRLLLAAAIGTGLLLVAAAVVAAMAFLR